MTERKEQNCFIIMPIADVEGYPQGHFKHVYENIISPACELAGYKAQRADEVKASNLIHLDILNKLIEAPIAICDLSTRNPNVLFELGIRQAFDKPVVLIQEKGTPRIFDIAPLRYLEYSKEMKYHEVLRSQQELKESLQATAIADGDAGNVNSIVKLLALNNPAKIPDLKDGKEGLAFEIMQAEMRELRKMMEISLMDRNKASRRGSISAIEYERISNLIEKVSGNKRIPVEERMHQYHMLMREAEELMMRCDEKSDHMHFRHLVERIHQAMSENA
tara:strand:- start:147 stop:977 length:831 start_codon:yes stop_codon:yes gene_type:complete